MDSGWWALLIGAMGVVIAALGLWRERARRPRWAQSWREEGSVLRFEVSNRGRGAALDVDVTTNDGENVSTEKVGDCAFAEGWSTSFLFNADPRARRLHAVWIPAAATPGSGLSHVSVTLEWSYSPRVHRRHQRVWSWRSPNST